MQNSLQSCRSWRAGSFADVGNPGKLQKISCFAKGEVIEQGTTRASNLSLSSFQMTIVSLDKAYSNARG